LTCRAEVPVTIVEVTLSYRWLSPADGALSRDFSVFVTLP
jgi:hypothetical protein